VCEVCRIRLLLTLVESNFNGRSILVISRLERTLGRFAIPNLTLFIIVGQVAVFVAMQQDARILERIALVPGSVLAGEVYRLLSFLVMPPVTAPIWAFFFWYLFYLMGTALEGYWGTIRYNLFWLIGYVATVGTGFITPDAVVSNWFLQGTVFLAFAYLNPNFELRVMFILPVKIKWFALLTWIGFVLGFVSGGWSERLTIGSAVANFLVFFGADIWARAKHGQRHMTGQAKRFAVRPAAFIHKCHVCGMTEKTNPGMDFRYCSKCSGDLCYCTDHIRSHEHINDGQSE